MTEIKNIYIHKAWKFRENERHLMVRTVFESNTGGELKRRKTLQEFQDDGEENLRKVMRNRKKKVNKNYK